MWQCSPIFTFFADDHARANHCAIADRHVRAYDGAGTDHHTRIDLRIRRNDGRVSDARNMGVLLYQLRSLRKPQFRLIGFNDAFAARILL